VVVETLFLLARQRLLDVGRQQARVGARARCRDLVGLKRRTKQPIHLGISLAIRAHV
jgi:hypothetical protein